MLQQRAPLISQGQVYLNEELNEYLVVTKNNRGQISYQGKGFVGHSEDSTFLVHFKPVDPADLEKEDLVFFKNTLPQIQLKVGLIQEA